MNFGNPPLSIVIMAGGTGGHVFPALAVAEKLRARGVNLHWLGTARGLEAEVVPAAGIEMHYLTVQGLRGKGVLRLLTAPFMLLRAVWQACRVLRQVDADAVIGLGGFASGPGGIAAWLLKRPLLIHEQNAIPGTTNRWLARVASQVLEAFPGSLPGARHVGNPVREAIAAIAPLAVDDRRRLHLLVLGGSLGALALNQMLPAAMALLGADERPDILHQCGRRHTSVTEQAYGDAEVEARVQPFLDDMASAYEWADFVICRAGALTVSELTLAGRGALLVPYPHAIDDHQTRNGEWLRDAGAAELHQQSELSAEQVADIVRRLNGNRQRLRDMAERARSRAMPEAANEVAGCCEVLAQARRRRVANG